MKNTVPPNKIPIKSNLGLNRALVPPLAPSTHNKKATTTKTPFSIWVIIASTTLAAIGGNFLGINLSGWGWVIPLAFSLAIILKDPGNIRFPIKIWLPWSLLLLVYFLFENFAGLQRMAQVLCPLVVGCAVSTLKVDIDYLEKFFAISKRLSIGLFIVVLAKTGVFMTGRLPMVTGLAAEVMIALVFCCLFAANFACGAKKDWRLWLLMLAIPVIAVTRGAIIACGITLPFTFGPLGKQKRVAILLLGLIAVLVLFNTERIQRKTFYSGQGDISQVLSGDIADSGRTYMRRYFMAAIEEKPWFGHGAGTGEAYTWYITFGQAGYPHNDWLLTTYEYGLLGAVIYLLTLLAASWHAFQQSKYASGLQKVFFLAGAGSFLPFGLLMLTDNIMVYASFFGNLQFMILGLAYAATHKQKKGISPTGRNLSLAARKVRSRVLKQPPPNRHVNVSG